MQCDLTWLILGSAQLCRVFHSNRRAGVWSEGVKGRIWYPGGAGRGQGHQHFFSLFFCFLTLGYFCRWRQLQGHALTPSPSCQLQLSGWWRDRPQIDYSIARTVGPSESTRQSETKVTLALGWRWSATPCMRDLLLIFSPPRSKTVLVVRGGVKSRSCTVKTNKRISHLKTNVSKSKVVPELFESLWSFF